MTERHSLYVQELVLHWVDSRGQWLGVASNGAGRRPHLRILLSSPISPRGQDIIQTPSAGIRSSPGIWYGFTTGYASRTIRVPLYGSEHQLRTSVGLGAGKTLTREAANFLAHFSWYRDLWGKRHCGHSPDHECEPRRDCRLTRNCLCAELGRVAHLSGNRVSAAYDTAAVWPLVCARHS